MAIVDGRTLLSAGDVASAQYDNTAGAASGSDNTDFYIEGDASQSFKVSAAVAGLLYDAGSAQDWSRSHFYIWHQNITAGRLQVLTAGGIRIRFCGATVTDFFEKYVGGSDTYIGGFQMLVVDIEKARRDAVAGTNGATGGTPPATSAVQYVGLVYDMAAMWTGGNDNCFVDAMWRLPPDTPGIRIEGDNTGSPWTWQDVVDAADTTDPTKAWGTCVRLANGTISLNTSVRIGADDATTDDFDDTGEVVGFADAFVADDLLSVSHYIQDALTTVDMADVTYLSVGQTAADMRVSRDASPGALAYDGCVWNSMRRFRLTGGLTLSGNCLISACGQIDPTNADYTGEVALVAASSHYVDTTTNFDLNSTSGDFEIIMGIRPNDWTPTGDVALLSHYAGAAATTAFQFQLDTTGALQLVIGDGAAITTLIGSVLTTNDNLFQWVRVTYDQSTGQADFFQSDDPIDTPSGDITWTAAGTPSGTSRIMPSQSRPILVGAENSGTPAAFFDGEIQYVEMWNDGFRATTGHGDLLLRGDWRLGGTWTTTRLDDFNSSMTWELQASATYTTGGTETTAATFGNTTIKGGTSESALFWNVNTDPVGELDGMTFVSAGTGHAIELGPNCPATIELVSHTYTDYAVSDGSTGNEALYNNSGKDITINVTTGGTPSIREGNLSNSSVATTTATNNNKTLTVDGLTRDARVFIIARAGGPEAVGATLASGEADATGTFTSQYNFSTTQPVTVRARLSGYLPYTASATITDSGLTLTAIWLVDSNHNGHSWKATQSIDLNGTDEYLDAGGMDEIYSHTAGFTVLTWYKRDTGAGIDTILSFEDADGSSRCTLLIDAGETIDIQGRDASDVLSGQLSSAVGANTITAWEHLGMAFNPSSTTGRLVRINGSTSTPSVNTTTGTDISANLDTAFLGAREAGANPWDGPLLEVVLVSGMLTAAQIDEHYNSGAPVDARTLSFASRIISYWHASNAEYDTATEVLVFRNIAPTAVQTFGYVDGVLVDSTNVSTDIP